MKKVLVITGPTASGKSALALEAAKRLNGEIISCDAMQIYKGMDIGTAKPTKDELASVPHHMIDVVDPETPYSCADFAAQGKKSADDILSRGKLPILCGGTGLYIDSLLGANVYSPPVPEGLREELSALSPDQLYEQLCKYDPESAEKIHKNNVKRVERALEIFLGTGITKTEWDRRSKEYEKPYDPIFAILAFRDRSKIYERTDKRVDEMIKAGLETELRCLDLKRDLTSAQGIGYKEMYRYIDGLITFDEAVEEIKKNTRNYVKRQETWFKRYPDAARFYCDEDSFENILNNLVKMVKNS